MRIFKYGGKVTNLIFTKKGEPELVERYLLPEFRQVNDALVKVGLELDVEPLQIVGTDGLIWNDCECFYTRKVA